MTFDEYWSGDRGRVNYDKANISAEEKTRMTLYRSIAEGAWNAARRSVECPGADSWCELGRPK